MRRKPELCLLVAFLCFVGCLLLVNLNTAFYVNPGGVVDGAASFLKDQHDSDYQQRSPDVGQPVARVLGVRRVLVVNERVPLFDSRGSDARMLQLCGFISKMGYQVDFLAAHPYQSETKDLHTQMLHGEGGVRNLYHAWNPSELDAAMGGSYDFVIASLWYWRDPSSYNVYAPVIRKRMKHTRFLALTDDSHAYRYWSLRGYDPSFDVGVYRKMVRDEKRALLLADGIITATEDDRERIREMMEPHDRPIFVVPYMPELPRHDHSQLASYGGPVMPSGGSIVFIGSKNAVNDASLSYLLRSIMPLIVKASNDTVQLDIVGKVALKKEDVKFARSRGVKVNVLGFLEDLGNVTKACRFFVSPIVAGTGINTKNVYALMHGRPVITSVIGSEGLTRYASADGPIFVAHDLADYAQMAQRLLTDDGLYMRASALAYKAVDMMRRSSGAMDSLERALSRDHVPLVGDLSVLDAYVTFVTLPLHAPSKATSFTYVDGALALASSILRHDKRHKLVAVVSNVEEDSVRKLAMLYDEVRVVEPITHPHFMDRSKCPPSPPPEDKYDILYDKNAEPSLGQQGLFTKLEIFNLSSVRRMLYIDADAMVLQDISYLFDDGREPLEASPDLMMPDTFNSGLMKIDTEQITINIPEVLCYVPTYQGGDQGLLNNIFSAWYRSEGMLPVGLNLQSKLKYGYRPGWDALREEAAVLHFSPERPWNRVPWSDVEDDETKEHPSRYATLQEELDLWWVVHGESGLLAGAANGALNYIAKHVDWTPTEDQALDLATGLVYHGITPPVRRKRLRVALHSQSYQEASLSGSEITTNGLAAAFKMLKLADGDIVRVSPTRLDPLLRNARRLDLLFIEGYDPSLPSTIKEVRKANPNIVIFFWHLSVCSSYAHRLDVDAFFTNSLIMAKHLQRFRPTFLMPLASDWGKCLTPSIQQQSTEERQGTVYLGAYAAAKGESLFSDVFSLFDRQQLDIYGIGWNESLWQDRWRGRWEGSPQELYSQADTVVGITVPSQLALGMVNNRILEALSCGAVVATDWHPHMAYVINKEAVMVYTEGGELLRPETNVLEAEIQRVRDLHTYEQRVQLILTVYSFVMERRLEGSI